VPPRKYDDNGLSVTGLSRNLSHLPVTGFLVTGFLRFLQVIGGSVKGSGDDEAFTFCEGRLRSEILAATARSKEELG
jgi:hypothetical protein